mmetsp:Transcript_29952/g.54562  ORF Transcript_29952/g.54562 Transcript_29952/m.54562 type:complete len:303 (-) Transcript_29952:246-1154(-)
MAGGAGGSAGLQTPPIDMYDVLGVSLDAEPEDVRKAYKKLSLQCHPDKVIALSSQEQDAARLRFELAKDANDILQDVERRKIYDAFGTDLGEERPEVEVWTVGMNNVLTPLFGFFVKTIAMRLVLWLLTFNFIGYLVILIGIVVAILYKLDVRYGEYSPRDPEALPLLIIVGVIVAVVILSWVWSLLAEVVGLLYLVSEVTGIEQLLQSWKIAAGVILASIFASWMVRNWWFWIVGLVFLFVCVILLALVIASAVIRLWIETVQTQHSEKVKAYRLDLRRHRKKMQDEVAFLRQKLQEKRAT